MASKMKDFLLKLLAVIVAGICTGIAVFFGWKVYQQEMMYKKGDDTYEMIEHLAQATPMTEEVPANKPEPSTFEPETTTPVSIIEDPEEPQNQEEPIPVAEIDFAALTAVNSDVVAWICCPDTVINYPVVHGGDNEYYLTHLVDGTENGNGTLFIDWKNSLFTAITCNREKCSLAWLNTRIKLSLTRIPSSILLRRKPNTRSNCFPAIPQPLIHLHIRYASVPLTNMPNGCERSLESQILKRICT